MALSVSWTLVAAPPLAPPPLPHFVFQYLALKTVDVQLEEYAITGRFGINKVSLHVLFLTVISENVIRGH